MVVASRMPVCNDRQVAVDIPVVDLSWRRPVVSELVVKACEEFGFFQVINHGVPEDVIARMEAAGLAFFALPAPEKQQAGPPTPLGYGSKNIGMSGDTGEVEYLLLHANPASVKQRAWTIGRKDPKEFSCVVNEYVEAVRKLACDILELLAEGLGLQDTGALCRLIRDTENDSLFRLNHYPPCNNKEDNKSSSRIGFGEHSDPQILSLLRSNGIAGLQILSPDGRAWVPVPPDPTAFCVNVGDMLQAMTNGRLVSVRHRAMTNSYSSRLSMVFFGAPPLHQWISPFPEMITAQAPCLYRPFTWCDYKKAMYSLMLGHNRLDLYQLNSQKEEAVSDVIS